MANTLVLLFHPNLSHSKANAALARAAAAMSNTDMVDMYAAYPGGIDMLRDGEFEAARLLAADHIVLQFPVQWYSTPPLLKAWQDAVLTRMFYLAYKTEGRRLEGTQLMIAATAGNTSDTYQPGGRNLFPMNELFAPLRATAHRCGLLWTKPFVLYKADKLTPAELEVAVNNYNAALRDWIHATSAEKAA
jgi:putative NADPH-quinone reductase